MSKFIVEVLRVQWVKRLEIEAASAKEAEEMAPALAEDVWAEAPENRQLVVVRGKVPAVKAEKPAKAEQSVLIPVAKVNEAPVADEKKEG